jgi:UDP-glucose 4-epimerase
MKLLLTGGAGYIGSACLRWLIDHGHDPVAFDDLSEGNPRSVPGGRLVEGDILDTDALAGAMRKHGTEAVMHFAALAIVPDSVKDPDDYYRVNVVGTKSVLDAMRRAEVPRIVFSSTCATYGNLAEMPLTEEVPQRPEHPYGTTKLAAERMIMDYARAYGLGYAILRYFNAAGADPDGSHGEDRRHETHLIPLTLQVAAGRRPKLTAFGDDWPTRDGSCVRDYIHTADLADAHQKAVEAIGPGEGRIYNVGSGRGASVFEVIRACGEVVGRPIPFEVAGRRPGDPPELIASPRKISSELGWSPRYTEIRSIVETAWRWLSTHPEGYGPKPSRP